MKYGIDIMYYISDYNFSGIVSKVLSQNKFVAIEFYYGEDVVDFDFSNFLTQIKSVSDDLGLEVVVHMPIYDLAIESKRIKNAVLDETKKIVEFAATLNCTKVITHGGSMGNVSSDHYTLQELTDRRLFVQNLSATLLRQMCDIASQASLDLCLENLFSHHYTNVTSDDLLLLKKMTDRDNLKFNYDLGHGNLTDENPIEYIHKIKEHLYHTHFHDNDGRFDYHNQIMTGTVDFQGIMQALKTINYDKLIMLETKNQSSSNLIHMYNQLIEIEQKLN
jgi:sugar phosphate isomerase/epimerase